MRIAQHFSAGLDSRFTSKSVKRTTEIEGLTGSLILFSAVRFTDCFDRPTNPSDKSLGYFHLVRFADETCLLPNTRHLEKRIINCAVAFDVGKRASPTVEGVDA
jgi:hypothetical protein